MPIKMLGNICFQKWPTCYITKNIQIGGISFSTCRSLDDLLEAVEIGNCIAYQGKYCNCESLLKKDALKSDSGGKRLVDGGLLQTDLKLIESCGCLGDNSAKKINFFPGQQISPYFSLSEVENCPKLHFFGKKLSRLAFFWV